MPFRETYATWHFRHYADWPRMEIVLLQRWGDTVTGKAKVLVGDWGAMRRLALILEKRGLFRGYVKPHYGS